jgi:23S rRNA (cytidine1920-2'-O)/16S rRNA (cytidine1409-2'-O)-methyltransferase
MTASDADIARYVSRAGLKLEHALRAFDLNVAALHAADLGCNVGGFTDCLLKHGAATVHAVDTAYGTLDWRLRNDPRVTVMERTNALHLAERLSGVRFDLVVVDLGWTPQRLAVPAALAVLRTAGCVISLVKPHYELTDDERTRLLHDGVITDADARAVLARVVESMPALGARVETTTESPIRGAKSSRRSKEGGNIEFLAHLTAI